MYFLLLEGLTAVPEAAPLWVPVPVIPNPARLSLRLIRISVSPLSIAKSISCSVGAVIDQPYFSWCDTYKPRLSAAALKRLL